MASLTTMEMELRTAKTIARGMEEDIREMELAWPQYKRGSRAQKFLDSLKERNKTLIQCLTDAEK